MATSSSASSSSAQSSKERARSDPVLRNALRYTISAREYELLHQYLLSRYSVLKRNTPPPPKTTAKSQENTERSSRDGKNPESGIGDADFNANAIRLTLRLFLTTYASLKLWDLIIERLFSRKAAISKAVTPFYKSPNFKLSLSLSSIFLFHRLLRRFFIRLRTTLLSPDAASFRRRNPRTTHLLASTITPAIGASLSGLFLGLAAADQTRIAITIYIFSRSLEFLYNYLNNAGWMKSKPSWLGSWLLMPFACGQLLQAFVFDRDCFPEAYGSFILKRSPEYIQQRPADYPRKLLWPSTFEIVDGLASVSQLKWPTFISPILIPRARNPVKAMAPITDPAHPGIKRLSCAILHPRDPSCGRTYVKYFLSAFPTMAKFFTIIYAAFALPRYKAFMAQPMTQVNTLAARILRTSFFLTSAIGTAWSSICLLQRILPGNVLPTSRWFMSGFLAGLWAFLERGSGRGNFLYSARMSLDSFWKVGKKKGWWKGVRSGDVILFAASLALINFCYEKDPKAIEGTLLRKSMGMLRGEGWVDRASKGKEPTLSVNEAEENRKDI